MTREELDKLLCADEYEFDPDKAADRILAALAREREGEVVLLEMPVDDEQGTIQDNLEAEIENINLQGKRGQLIFRPAKGGECHHRRVWMGRTGVRFLGGLI